MGRLILKVKGMCQKWELFLLLLPLWGDLNVFWRKIVKWIDLFLPQHVSKQNWDKKAWWVQATPKAPLWRHPPLPEGDFKALICQSNNQLAFRRIHEHRQPPVGHCYHHHHNRGSPRHFLWLFQGTEQQEAPGAPTSTHRNHLRQSSF